MKSSRSMLSLFFLSIFVLFFLAGCGKMGKQEKISFLYWGSAAQLNMYEQIKTAFQKKYPQYKLELIGSSWRGYNQKLYSMLSSGEVADVVKLPSVYQYASKGTLTELSGPLVEGIGLDTSKLFTKAVDLCSYQGKLYALPVGVDTKLIYINKELFAKAGVAVPNKPWTMAEFLAAAKKLTFINESDASTTQYGFAIDVNPERFIPFFWSNGGDIISGDKLVFNTPSIRNVLKFFVNMRLNDKIIPPLEAQLQEGNVAPFMTGQIAMYMAGRYLVPELLGGTTIEWDVIPLPYFQKPAATIEGSQFGIPVKAKNPKAGMAFMKYLAYEEGAKIIAEFGDTVPALTELANSKEFLEWKGINNKVFLDQLQYSRYVDLKNRPNGEKIISRMGETIWNMFLGQESVDKGCEKIEREIQAVDKE